MLKKAMATGLVLAVTLGFGMFAHAAGKVLLVQSYHTGYPWVDSINDGVKKGLEGSGAQLEIFYMDTKRKTDAAWKQKAGQMAKDKVGSFKPDVVITADDNAQQFFAKDYAGKPGPQFVFCGVNAEASKYGYPAANVTGILERPHFAQTVEMIQSFMPNVKKVAVLTDSSPTSDAVVAYMKTRKVPAEVVAYAQPKTFPEWQETVKKFKGQVDAVVTFNYHTVQPAGGGNSMDPKEVMSWTIANSPVPVVALMPFGVEDGGLCGIVESGEEHGFEAAQIALKIIGGKKAGDFPIAPAKKGLVMINLKTAEKVGAQIPFDTIQAADKVVK